MAAENLESLIKIGIWEFQSSLGLHANGDLDFTRMHLLKASENLFNASAMSTGALRDSRKRIAQQFLDEVNSLNITDLPVTMFPTNKAALSIRDDTQAKGWIVREKPDICFEDIAGLEGVKELIRLKLLYPFTHPVIAEKYCIHPGDGMVFL